MEAAPPTLSRRLLLGASVLALPAMDANRAAKAASVPMPLSPTQAARLASIGGAVTETVYALGLGQQIVAVDTTSLYPPAALQEKKNLGYMRALAAEGVLSVDPTAILLIDGSGPPAVVEQLRQSPIPVVPVDGAPTAASVSLRARFLGQVLGVADKGEALAQRIEAGFRRLDAAREAETRRPAVMFVMSLRSGRPMAAGRDTAADAMITLSGGRNALSGMQGYKALTDEAVILAAPDILLMMQGGADSIQPEAVLALPAFRATPAGRNGAAVVVDGESLLGFGPRTPETALDLMQRFAGLMR